MRRPSLLALLCAWLAIVCSGCVSSVHPLTTIDESVADPALIGEWKPLLSLLDFELSRPPPMGTIAISHGSNPHVLIVRERAAHKQTPGEKPLSAQAYCTQIGDIKLVSLKEDDKTTYKLCAYRMLDGDLVGFTELDSDFVRSAVKRGELTAKASEPSILSPGVELNAPSQALRAFVAKHGMKCFSDFWFVLVRQRNTPRADAR